MYTVARELGHKSQTMIEERYGHIHERTKKGGTQVVEFRAEDYGEELRERLAALSAKGDDDATAR